MGMPQKTSHLTRNVIVVAVVLVVVVAGGYYAYQNSFQPNIQATNYQVGYPQTYPVDTPEQNIGKVSSTGSFSYTATANGAADLIFDNSFSFITSKAVSVSYNAAGAGFSKSFTVPAGQSYTLQVPLGQGQSVSGTFSVTGGSGNDVNFLIDQYTCSESVPFSVVLVNSGNANGYAKLGIETEGGVGVYLNNYFVPQGQQVPVSGSAVVQDCSTHNFAPVVTQQKG